MISVAEATEIILDNTKDYGVESLPLRQTNGRVLREPLLADRDFPPFNRVAMDGIAIRYEAYAAGQRSFPVEGILGAGAEPRSLKNPEGCIEVMTGAVLPEGADTVVRYEEVELHDGIATIQSRRVKKEQNVQKQGLERRKGELIVRQGRRLSPAEAGVAATVGKATVKVARLPRTVIIYTGSELVEVEEAPRPHQIRASNVYTIASVLEEWSIKADLLHLPDDELYIRREVQDCLKNYDLILLTGGISKGKYDYVPAVLLESGVSQLFYKVAQRPGKPFWFGNVPGGPFVFALPGNPVSAFMCTLRYAVPWLRASLGMAPFEGHYTQLSEDLVFKKAQTYFIQVKTRFTLDGRMIADAVSARGSGDLASLADADGFIELPPERKAFKAGVAYRYYAYR